MTPIADMVRKLFEKGVDQEAILIAIEAAEQAMLAGVSTRHPPDSEVDKAAERRREWDREYRRRTRSSTRHPPESTRHPPDSENASLSKESKKEEITRKEERRGQRLSADWKPDSDSWMQAIAVLQTGERVNYELDKFRDHWKQQPGSKGVKLDWNATWRNWARRAAEYAGTRNGKRTIQDAARDLHQEALRRLAEFEKPAPGGLCDGTGEDAIRLLPSR